MKKKLEKKLIEHICDLYYKNLHGINDNLIDNNIESHFSTLISNTFNQSIEDILFDLSKSHTLFSFELDLSFQNYLDYLIFHLEKKPKKGMFLAAKFIKQINTINKFPGSIQFTYQVYITEQGEVIGRSSTPYCEESIYIKNIYNKILMEEMEKSIHTDIQILLPDLTVKKSQIVSENICRNIILSQTSLNKKLVILQIKDFFKLISYTNTLKLNQSWINTYELQQLLIETYPSFKKLKLL